MYEATAEESDQRKRVRALIESATIDCNFSLLDLREYAKKLNEDRENDRNKKNTEPDQDNNENTHTHNQSNSFEISENQNRSSVKYQRVPRKFRED